MRDSEKFLARLRIYLGIGHPSKVACSVLMQDVFAFTCICREPPRTHLLYLCAYCIAVFLSNDSGTCLGQPGVKGCK